MSKATPVTDLTRFFKSTFTLTFAVEILGINVWHDCKEGWLDLGPYSQGVKIQYQLYSGQHYDIDIIIWPHVAKIWCGTEYGFVRTWQFLQRRWITFSIRHAFPVRVLDLRKHVATVIPTYGIGAFGSNAKNDKVFEVFLPPLAFGERRYFAPVIEAEESIWKFIKDLIWKCAVDYIPASYLDGPFDVPYAVSDVRHQDAILYYVRETILNSNLLEEDKEFEIEEATPIKDRRESKMPKQKEVKKAEPQKEKFEIKLPGDAILAGTGRIVPFEVFGDRPHDIGEIIVLISSNNLPAQDDFPVMFVNVDNLLEAPIKEFKRLRISQIYTRWKIGEEEHNSEPQPVKSKSEFKMNDHHSVPLPLETASEVAAKFLDNPFEVQLRGIKQPPLPKAGILFGYDKNDTDYNKIVPPKLNTENLDVIIAVAKINAKVLAKGDNAFIRGEYPLYPPKVSCENLDRHVGCTNDINEISTPVKPELIVHSYIILEAQIILQVSMGFVGCNPRKPTHRFSRLFCLVRDSSHTLLVSILHMITQINENTVKENTDDLLTGFVINTGDVLIYYVEGPKDGMILQVWEMMSDYYPKAMPRFSSCDEYVTRLYPDLLKHHVPFVVLKMYTRLGMLLACPPLYSRPALPLPARSALLKIDILLCIHFKTVPSSQQLPTLNELRSFWLEMCVPRKSFSL